MIFFKNMMDGEKISIKNKALVISLVLMLFLILGAVSAADTNVSDIQNSNENVNVDLNEDNDILESTSDDNLQDNEEKTNLSSTEGENSVASPENNDVVASQESEVLGDAEASMKVVSPSVIVNKEAFSVRLTDANGNGLANKEVKFSLNGGHFTRYTDASGYANLKLNLQTKYYTIHYMFNEAGYTTVKGNSTFLVVSDNQPTFAASTYIAYRGFMNPYTVALSVDGVKLADKRIKLTLDGKTYYRTTDADGKAVLNIFLSPGTYVVRYIFDAQDGLKKASGCKTIIVRQGMPITITSASSLTMPEMVSTPYKVKVLDARGNPVNGKIIFKIKGKSYTRTIGSDGIASVNIKLPQGTYKIASYHNKDSLYNYRYLSKDIKTVQVTKDHGFWIFGSDMNNVNLNTLNQYGTKHIFLNYYALELYGKANVEKFISKANNYGMKVHIWMQVFYDGNWISPVNSDGSYKYSFFNSKINEAKSYAAIKGVAGVHMDYLRFPGTAYKHQNGVEAINYFTKQLATAVHKVNSKLIVSAAVMPEVSSNKYYYGQDIPTLSKYLDVIVPMIYKGNYEAGTSWIKSTTAAFVKQSNGAKIWTGLQAYRSDDDVTKLSSTELYKDAKAAMEGGAAGVISFRWGVSNYIKFHTL